ncbi:hypothetical protein J7399_19590 [Shimia sp. R9_1]|uniref:hypothetical protein n=1 Tax=Shimia sp. R9_1 TaxID=2821111 RepID=UPI001AD96AE0|nr:hypothetical protein [Shimia sp. R9_1]MBO9409650.1 hypothetical protein [Shimia sp. R9_1]
MSDDEQQISDFERAKWADEVRLREREISARELEVQANLLEQQNKAEHLKIDEQKSRQLFRSPFAIAILAAAVAAGGNAYVAYLNGKATSEVERLKGDQTLILEAIRSGDPDQAAENLRFAVDARLIFDEGRRAEIQGFLDRRQQGEGPSLPVAGAPSLVERRIDCGDAHPDLRRSHEVRKSSVHLQVESCVRLVAGGERGFYEYQFQVSNLSDRPVLVVSEDMQFRAWIAGGQSSFVVNRTLSTVEPVSTESTLDYGTGDVSLELFFPSRKQ